MGANLNQRLFSAADSLRSKMDAAFIFLFLLAIAGYLLYRGIRLEKEKT